MEPAKIQSLLFVKVLGFLKPGWKDSNFQVMKAKFSLVSTMVTTATVFGKRSTAYVLSVVVDKLADIKVCILGLGDNKNSMSRYIMRVIIAIIDIITISFQLAEQYNKY